MARFTLTREFFIPKNATKICDKNSDAIAYVFTDASGRPCAKVFYGKQAKPVLYCHYRDEARRAASIKSAFDARAERQSRMKKYADERKAYVHSLKVGDVLSTCWGYDQTNREFYQVVSLFGKSGVIVREIGTDGFETSWAQGKKSPMVDNFIGPELRRKATQYGVKITSCATATPHRFTEVAGVKVYEAASYSSYA